MAKYFSLKKCIDFGDAKLFYTISKGEGKLSYMLLKDQWLQGKAEGAKGQFHKNLIR